MTDTPVLLTPLMEGETIRVCCHCRRVKAPSGEWSHPHYRANQIITHVICPTCLRRHYPEIAAVSNE